MFKCKWIVFVLLAFALTDSFAYCQEKVDIRQTITVSGIVTNVDAVGNIIEVRTDQGIMAFSVPDKAVIIEKSENIGLMDIEPSDPVTIQYYSPSPGKFVVVSITCNKDF